MTTEYRWNEKEAATGYDQAAPHVHPLYVDVQQQISPLIASLPAAQSAGALVVDIGGGSGRLLEALLGDSTHLSAAIVDQSAPFLDLARQRLQAHGDSVQFVQARLQDRWSETINQPVAIVSSSAIHHLEFAEKRELFRQCYDALLPGGLFINGDEIRPASDDQYLAELNDWWRHMDAKLNSGEIPPNMRPILESWRERNIDRFPEPRFSGDDCHETIDAQLTAFGELGFEAVACAWTQRMWAVMVGRKPAE